jgi:hypothetical protein
MTDAGYRRIAIPRLIVPDLTDYLDVFVEAKPDAPVFTGEKGGAAATPRPPVRVDPGARRPGPGGSAPARPAPQRPRGPP